MKHTIVCDYDGVLELGEGKPNKELIAWLNKKKDTRLIIWTSRDWLYYDYIQFNLNRWGLKFDFIMCGKPLADMYIDDKAVNIKDLKFN